MYHPIPNVLRACSSASATGVRNGAFGCSLFFKPIFRHSATSVSAILSPQAATSITGDRARQGEGIIEEKVGDLKGKFEDLKHDIKHSDKK